MDKSIGEFWEENPWDISKSHNLSNHERQRFYLNHKGQGFFDLSFLSGADAEGDGRSVVAGDFRNNGQLDLVVRKCGGGPLTLYENHCPKANHLQVTLRGRKSNRLGIGSRLELEVGSQKQVRELYPINSYFSQMPARAHFGLGKSERIDRLTIRWPSGLVQTLADLDVNRHIVIEEGVAGIETVVPGRTIRP